MDLLFPGRHHLLTRFQFEYIQNILKNIAGVPDRNHRTSLVSAKIDALIFAVTSANHSHTRRNPLPFYLRAIALESFSSSFEVPSYIYGIDDVGQVSDFASYTLKKIKHESDGRFDLNPDNTLVLCSTPVLEMYEKLGFKILPAELDRNSGEYKEKLPWDIVETIAGLKAPWSRDDFVRNKMHPSSLKVWVSYSLGERVQRLFQDNILGADGDLTETRDYNTYVRQMDEIAELKYGETAPFIRPGRIGDIGCAVGSWIKLATLDERLHESDFYGIEASRHLCEICRQRKENGEFRNPYVFFSQKNAVSGLVFEKASMHTIHTSSLTHEIESYGGRKDLLAFIANRYQELVPGGVWINRDVVGPEEKDKSVYLWLNDKDGENQGWNDQTEDRLSLAEKLGRLSTRARFYRFARDFRRKEGQAFAFELASFKDREYFCLRMADACEFLSKKDYVDNWQSEMHETFCYFSFSDWKQTVEEKGFKVSSHSKSWANPWIVKNRIEGKAELFSMDSGSLSPIPYPVTNMLLICEK